MNKLFNCIGIVGHPRNLGALATHELLCNWLSQQGYRVLVEEQIAQQMTMTGLQTANLEEIGQQADLAVVIGGDGNMLGAARVLARFDIKVIGINRGNLGFLTDLDPENAIEELAKVLNGHYLTDPRSLLEASVRGISPTPQIATALNEVVLHPGKVAHMIEFEVYIDNQFAFSQRSDGLIISSTTGSTAYSLSAGGPILMPALEAIAIVPMFPHTLSARPLVIDCRSTICLRFPALKNELEVSCDSQLALPIQPGDEVVIRRSPDALTLLHPKEYNYFNTLTRKLGWSQKLS